MSQCETLQPEGQALPDVASISEPSPLDQLLPQGARQMLMTTVEAEVAAYIEAHQHEVDEQGRRLVVRNGRAQERTLVSGVGPIKIRAPRVNDRRVDEQGRKFRFTSEILPPYLRRTESVEELIPQIDEALPAQIALRPGLVVTPPNFFQAHHRGGRQARRVGAQQGFERFRGPCGLRSEMRAAERAGKSAVWDGNPAAIGAGIYRRDIPGTCESEEVNAGGLEAAPSSERLQEFVRCAAMELESQGYFAIRALSSDPRWSSRSIYVFGLDTYGYTLFSGDPYSQGYGVIAPELNDHLDGPFGGRDVVSVGDAFGETFLYYSARNPASGMMQNKVTFVKRVVAYGLPIMVGSGYYLDEGP